MEDLLRRLYYVGVKTSNCFWCFKTQFQNETPLPGIEPGSPA